MKQTFQVSGMTCSACSANVEKSVRKLPGVREVSVNLLSGSMRVDYDESALNADGIIRAVQAAGYGASLPGAQRKKGEAGGLSRDEEKSVRLRLIVSFIFLIPLMYVSMGHMLGLPMPAAFHGGGGALIRALTQFLLTLPVVIAGQKYYRVGFKTLWRRSPNMDSLIAMGSAASLAYGVIMLYRIAFATGAGDTAAAEAYAMDLYFESAAMILTLITLGKYLESRSKGKTGEAIKKLIDLAPKTALVEREGAAVEVSVEEVRVGETVQIRPGSAIAVDGTIISGATSVDQSALTGESIPVEKREGDTVSAGTLNKNGFIRVRVDREAGDTTLSQIVKLVEEAGASKAPIGRLADKISGVFVPVVIAIALFSGVLWWLLGRDAGFALSIAISVLVVSCPCALGLATPVAIMVGTGRAASLGILFKNAEALERVHSVNAVVLDKTGTLTEGKPRVTDVVGADGVAREQLLRLAASLEAGSEHPLAEAVMEYVSREGIRPEAVEGFEALPGLGVRAKLDGAAVLAGNLRQMREADVDLGSMEDKAQALAAEGKTPLYFAQDGRVTGLIAVADGVKSTSAEAVAEFKKLGIETVMLTGDNRLAAEAVGRQLGIDSVVSEVMPEDKERAVRQLQSQGKVVAMVGDGINDAPALTRADVGVAIGAGADIAIESADVVLMKSDLLDAVSAVRLGRAVIRNIKENLFWAFFYNAIGIPLAAGAFYSLLGWKLNPMFGAAAMSLSSVCVVSNALRLRAFKPWHAPTQPAPEACGVACDAALTACETADTDRAEGVCKTIGVEGMMCEHCQAHVKEALESIEGVSARVSLEDNAAYVTLTRPVADETLAEAIEQADYKVTYIK